MTRAMEAVSAVKMRKSQNLALTARPYALAALYILKELRGRLEETENLSPLLKKEMTGRHAVVIITSDKGLAGAFNSQVIRAAEKFIKEKGPETKVIAIGKKGRDYFRRRYSVVHEFLGSGDFGTLEEVRPISEYIQNYFTGEKIESLTLIYTNFLSALRQETTVRTLLPLEVKTLEEIVRGIVPLRGKYANMPEAISLDTENGSTLLFEPSAVTLLTSLLPKLIEIEILHAVLEANASEHSARMMAMKSASDNASDLILNLTVLYNKARQAAITKELGEITAGKEALNNS